MIKTLVLLCMPIFYAAFLLGSIIGLTERRPASDVITAPDFSLSTQAKKSPPPISRAVGGTLIVSMSQILAYMYGYTEAKQVARFYIERQTAPTAISQEGSRRGASIATVPANSMTVSMEMRPPNKIERPPKAYQKLTSSLSQLLEAYRKGGMVEARVFAKNHNMVFEDDRVQVTVVSTEEAIGQIRSAVEAVGGKYQLHYKNFVQALVPIGKLEVLAQRPDILIIREPRRATVE